MLGAMNAPGHRLLAASVLLAAVTLAALWPVLGNGFVNFDDDKYVTGNPGVSGGLTLAGIRWALTSTYASNWHPVTWISHMSDVSLYGLDARGHHLSSLILHVANTILLFLVLTRMTGVVGRSAFAAALFGVHPLHVESVAWVAERKDVLSTLFWLLGIWAYVRQVAAPSARRYALVAACLVLGLASKPMLVTFPFALLLLDYWPLGRWCDSGARGGHRRRGSTLILEKLPLIALAAASAVITLSAQGSGKAMVAVERFPVGARVANAIVSYVAYLGKTIWPAGLAVYYPFSADRITPAHVLSATVILAVVTTAAVLARRRAPYLLVGWLWYLGTLVPVIGLVQVGGQAIADRYTYVPLIGVFVAVSWGAGDLLARLARPPLAGGPAGVSGRWSIAAAVPASLVVVILAALANGQAHTWRDSTSLFEHAVAVTPANAVAETNLGNALFEQGRADEAIRHYQEALRVGPESSIVRYNLGYALLTLGRTDEAIPHLEAAVRVKPDFGAAQFHLGLALLDRGDASGAVEHFTRALDVDPGYPDTHCRLGLALAILGRTDEAAAQYAEAIRLSPANAGAQGALGILLAKKGRAQEALPHLLEAVKLEPGNPEARYNLGTAYASLSRWNDAAGAFEEAIRLRPGYGAAHHNLAGALFYLGRYRESWEEIRASERNGFVPSEKLVRMLREKLPEPSRD